MTGIKKRLGSMLGPEGRVPTLIAGEVTPVSSTTPPNARISKTGDAEYSVSFDVPRGLPGVNAVPTDEAVATFITSEDSETRQTADNLYYAPAAQADYVSTLSGMANYKSMTVEKLDSSGTLEVACHTPSEENVRYTITNANRYQYVGEVRATGDFHQTAGYRFIELEGNVNWVHNNPDMYTTPYTVTVGDTWTREVTTTDPYSRIIFASYTDNRGGIWRISLDGSDKTSDISTWHTTGLRKEQYVFTLPKPGTYTVRGEFVGADPSAPTSGQTPRGWVYPENTVGDTSVIRVLEPDNVLLSRNSNKDFALRIRPLNGEDTEFVPYHGTNSESFASPTIYRTAGQKISLSELVIGRPIEVESFEWTQHIYGRNSSTGSRNIIEVWTTQRIDKDGKYSVVGRWKTLEDIETGSNAYHIMMMGELPLFREAISSLEGRYNLDGSQAPTSIRTAEGNRTDGWVLLSNDTDFVAAVRYDNRGETLRVGKPGEPERDSQTFIELRTDGGMAKVYAKAYESGSVIPVGRVHRFAGTYFYGLAPGARNALTLL